MEERDFENVVRADRNSCTPETLQVGASAGGSTTITPHGNSVIGRNGAITCSMRDQTDKAQDQMETSRESADATASTVHPTLSRPSENESHVPSLAQTIAQPANAFNLPSTKMYTSPYDPPIRDEAAASYSLPPGSVPAWAILAPPHSRSSYNSPYQQKPLLPRPSPSTPSVAPVVATPQYVPAYMIPRGQPGAIDGSEKRAGNGISQLFASTLEDPQSASRGGLLSLERDLPVGHDSFDGEPDASNLAKSKKGKVKVSKKTLGARRKSSTALEPGNSSQVQQSNHEDTTARQESPNMSVHSERNTSVMDARQITTPSNGVTEASTFQIPGQSASKVKRRTAAEIQELHAHRDRAGLPRLKHYPTNRDVDVDPARSSPSVTPAPRGMSEDPIDNRFPGVQTQKTPAKRGRPKKNAAEPLIGNPIEKPATKRGRPKKIRLEESIESQSGETPVRKKRAYNKKIKPEQDLQDARTGSHENSSQNGMHEMLDSTGRTHTDNLAGSMDYVFTGEAGTIAHASDQALEAHQPNLADAFSHNMYPEIPSMYTPSHPVGENAPGLVDGMYSAQNEQVQHVQAGNERTGSQPANPYARPSIEEYDGQEEYLSDESADEEEDDDEDEDSAVYSNIMSQVNMITGTAPVNKGRGHAKQGFEDFLNFTDAEVEEEEEEEEAEMSEDEVEVPRPELARKPEKPKVLRRVRRRGPRVAAEPTGDIKMRLGLANEAFANSDMTEARRLVDEIVRINAETYEAWNLLSSICQEQQDCEGALMSLIVAAHLRPKYEGAWFNAVDYALTSMGPVTPRLLREAEFCLSSCIRQVPHSIEGRIRKAQVLVQRGAFNRAATDYRHVLRRTPYDLQLIRELGEVYVDLGDGRAGLELYHKTLQNFKEHPESYDLSLDWNHAHCFAQLWTFMDKKSSEALKEVKALARYLLGRAHETYWDQVTENDCEWDGEDERRMSIVQYAPGDSPLSAYGEGLPLEMRVPLGKFRLAMEHHTEAMRHFNHLLGDDPSSGEPYGFAYPDLLLSVGESYEKKEKYSEALLFYQALKQVPYENSAELCLAIGKCFLRDDRTKEAEESFREACLLDATNITARVELARLYERLDEAEQAFDYVSQILELESHKRIKLYGTHNLPVPPQELKKKVPRASTSTVKEKRPRKVPASVQSREAIAEALRQSYRTLKDKAADMREGDANASDYWLDAARALTDDFRSCKAFYPWDRKEFDGYTAQDRLRAEQNLKLDFKVLSQMQGQNIEGNPTPATTSSSYDVPNHYRGVSFSDWVEIFAEYALCLARRGRGREAYDICESATHAICFCFDKQAMFTLQLTYCLCALITNDEETCVAMARWFMTQYQFSTDSYRMFAALMRVCHSPISWYCSSPTQKFILRQIKTMDYALANETRKKIIHKDKAAYSQLDERNQPIVNKELDVSLLMIYGHILIAGASYVYALNYFHRALAIDPENPVIALSLGLSYMQYALKRQIDNRQFVITQGVTYMNKYYIVRSQSPHFEERQEAHYNLARAYHLVGLTSLALPLYKSVLKAEGRKRKELSGYSLSWKESGDLVTSDDKTRRADMEDMCLDTAYNLQIIYTVAGNNELAQKITRKWLVI